MKLQPGCCTGIALCLAGVGLGGLIIFTVGEASQWWALVGPGELGKSADGAAGHVCQLGTAMRGSAWLTPWRAGF